MTRSGTIPIEVVLNGTPLSDEVDVDFGNRTRARRLKKIVETMQTAPEKSFPEMFGDDAELEAFYRLLRNPNIAAQEIVDAHCEATARRCQSLGKVVAIHDTTEFSFPLRDEVLRELLCRFSKNRQGFLAHTTIAASADGLRAPLGCLGLRPYVHKKGSDEETRKFWDERFGAMERESERWWEAVVATEARLEDVETVIHVMDREADIYKLLGRMDQHDYRHIIRAAQDRSVIVAEHPELEADTRASHPGHCLAWRSSQVQRPTWLADPRPRISETPGDGTGLAFGHGDHVTGLDGATSKKNWMPNR